jgi:hypothetical protein
MFDSLDAQLAQMRVVCAEPTGRRMRRETDGAPRPSIARPRADAPDTPAAPWRSSRATPAEMAEEPIEPHRPARARESATRTPDRVASIALRRGADPVLTIKVRRPRFLRSA